MPVPPELLMVEALDKHNDRDMLLDMDKGYVTIPVSACITINPPWLTAEGDIFHPISNICSIGMCRNFNGCGRAFGSCRH